jgi:hypothetical protein
MEQERKRESAPAAAMVVLLECVARLKSGVVGAWRRRGEVVEAVRVGLASWAASRLTRRTPEFLFAGGSRPGRKATSLDARPDA